MGIHRNFKHNLVALSLLLVSLLVSGSPSKARGIAPAFTPPMHRASVPSHAHATRTRKKAGTARQQRRVVQYLGRRRREVIISSHQQRHRHKKTVKHVASSRHAYPLNFFMLKAPDFDQSPLPTEIAQKIHAQFTQGTADSYAARSLVRAGLVTYFPMHGGIFWRREPVKYIIVHSTETGRPIGATRVIDAWSSLGRRHAGAQYVVDRDGSIYQAVDPDLATVHINIFKTLPGINNDNSIGIEMVHAGKQTYPPEQKLSVVRLVTYLQDRYKVAEGNIITHRYAQQGDHTDPVGFDWEGFLSEQKIFHMQSIALRMNKLSEEIARLTPASGLTPTVYMQPHGKLANPTVNHAGGNTADAGNATAFKQGDNTNETGKLVHTEKAATKQHLQPALRGPIEMDPQTAVLLNSAKDTPGSKPEKHDNN